MKGESNKRSRRYRLCVLCALKYGEISEGLAVELTGISRMRIRDEMYKLCGKYQPMRELEDENAQLKKEVERLKGLLGRRDFQI